MKDFKFHKIVKDEWCSIDFRQFTTGEYWTHLCILFVKICILIGLAALAQATVFKLGDQLFGDLPGLWLAIGAFAVAVLPIAFLVGQSVEWHFFNVLSKAPVAGVFLLAGIGLLFAGTHTSAYTHIAAGIILILASSIIMALPYKSKQVGSKGPEDWLYRRFFANRIARYLTEDHSPLHRIAILGPWGVGKTQTLKLIQWELEQLLDLKNDPSSLKARCVWINPWKASDKYEAFQVIADGFKEVRSPVGQLVESTMWGWIQSLLTIFGYESVTHRVFEAIRSNFPNEANRLLRQIDQEIGRKKLRLFVFVDDMERAEPEVIRAILPVIDRLSEMQNCFFLFGIDRGRMEDAFAHLQREVIIFQENGEASDPNGAERDTPTTSRQAAASVTGYLDKVIDLQLDLPAPAGHEIVHFARVWLKPYQANCKKLLNAFDALAPRLPLNVRQCEKFLKSATQTELLFLKNYGDKERDFEALFFVILGEACFPGFRQYLSGTIADWSSLSNHKIMDLNRSQRNTRDTDDFKAFQKKLAQELGIRGGEETSHQLALVLEQIVDRFGGFHLFSLKNTEDPEWVVSGYLVQRVLPFKQREDLLNAWLDLGEQRRFSELLRDPSILPVAERPSDEAKAILQILEGNLAEAVRRLKLASTGRPVTNEELADAESVIGWMAKYAKYFSVGREGLDPLDRAVLEMESGDRNESGPVVVACFEELIKALPIPEQSDGWRKKLLRCRIKAFQTILLCLDPVTISEVTRRHLFPRVFILPEELNQDSQSELREVATLGRAHLSKIFVEQFPKNKWDDVFEMVSRAGRRRPFVLLEPDLWVPLSDGKANMEFMEQLSPAEGYEEIFRSNLFEITARIFLRPLSDTDSHDLGFRVRQLLNDSQGHMIPYFRAFWNLSLRFLDKECKQELLELREMILQKAAEEESSNQDLRLRQETVQKAFPLADEDSSADAV